MDRDLEEDIRNDFIIMSKIKEDRYAQNVYAALCNIRWQPKDVWPVLKDEWWTCSWRSAGDIVSELQGQGDYMNWYCSGIQSGYDDNAAQEYVVKGYVPEATVTDEISADFARLGWHWSEWPNN